MALNKEKVTATALKYLQKGQIDKAVREYEKILEVDPTDEHSLHKVGDLYLRMNRKQEALNMYHRVSELYVRQGFYLKAIAVYKQILNIDPKRLELHIKMAEMYNQLGLLSETVNQYQFVARRYEEEQRHVEALDILRQVTRLDPENLPNKIKLAEGLVKHGMVQEGIETYQNMMKELERLKKEDEYLRVAERYLQHNPADHAISCKLARIYLNRDEPKKSLHILQNTLRLDHNNIAALELFAEGFITLKQLGKAVTVFKEMVQLLKRNRSERAKLEEILERIVSLDPEEHESRKLLEELQKRPDARPAPQTRPVETVVGDFAKKTPSAAQPVEHQTVPPAFKASRKKEDTKTAVDIDRLLTEGEIFIKYGLLEKAEERLEVIIAVENRDSVALERIKNFCLALNKPEIAAHQLLVDAVRFLEKGQLDQAVALVEESLSLEVNTAKVREISGLINSGNIPLLHKALDRFLSGASASEEVELFPSDSSLDAKNEQGLQLEAEVEDVEELEELEALDSIEEIEALEALEELEELAPQQESEAPEIVSYMDDIPEAREGRIEAEQLGQAEEFSEIELEELEESEIAESEDVLTVEKATTAVNIDETNENNEAASELELDFESHNYREENAVETASDVKPARKLVAERDLYKDFEYKPAGFKPVRPLMKEAVELLVTDAVEEITTPPPSKPVQAGDDDDFEVLEEIVVYKDTQEEKASTPDFVIAEDEVLEDVDFKEDFEETPGNDGDQSGQPAESVFEAQPEAETIQEFIESTSPDASEIEIKAETVEAETGAYDFDVESAVEQEIMEQAENSARQQQLEAEPLDTDSASAENEESAGTSAVEDTAELEILEDIPLDADSDELSFEDQNLDVETLKLLEQTVVDFDRKVLDVQVEAQTEASALSPMDSFEQELFAALEKTPAANDDEIAVNDEAAIPEQAALQTDAEDDASGVLDEDLEEMLEEADFFLKQELFEEAIEIYDELVEKYPANKKFADLLARAWELFDVRTSADNHNAPGDAAIGDLADELFEGERGENGGNLEVLEEYPTKSLPPELPETPRVTEGGAEADDSVILANEVFAGLEDGQELKLHSRNVSAANTVVADVDGIKTHYKLGVAYKEMGLLNEAIAEFNLASDGGMFFDANAMLGACYLQKKMNLKALSFFRKLVKHPDMTRARLMELRYNVAQTYEESGELDIALRYYRKIGAIDSTFEDATARAEAFEEQGIAAASVPDDIEAIFEEAEKMIPPDIESFSGSGSSDGNVGYI